MQKVVGPAIENVMNDNIQFHPKKYIAINQKLPLFTRQTNKEIGIY